MEFKIHMEFKDGTSDSIVLEGDTIEEVQKLALKETKLRGSINNWSERLS